MTDRRENIARLRQIARDYDHTAATYANASGPNYERIANEARDKAGAVRWALREIVGPEIEHARQTMEAMGVILVED